MTNVQNEVLPPNGLRRLSVVKKVPPPTPDRREGRLFPPEQSLKTSRLLNELLAGGNKFLCEISLAIFRHTPSHERCEIDDLRKLASQLLVFHA
jgi:hypothetical protein